MNNKKFISEGPGLPNWLNPISHAVVANNMCFVSGQLSVNEAGQYVSGTIEEETMRAFNNVFAAITAADFLVSDIVYIDIAFSDLSQVDAVNQIYLTLFSPNKRPARTIYEAARLPYDAKVKIVATAVKSD